MIIQEYNLQKKVTPDGWLHIKVVRCMYGLPQAGSLGQDFLVERLNKEGHFQNNTPGLWKYKNKPLMFTLIVKDFGIEYIKREQFDHLINTLQKYYDFSVHLEGKEYIKIKLDWDYDHGFIHLSMQCYLAKALK